MALPTTLSTYAWPADGIAWMGPFISSTGNVYVLGIDSAATTSVAVWKATDPTTSFTKGTNWLVVAANAAMSCHAHQVGDTLHVFASINGRTLGYRTYAMGADTWGTAVTQAFGAASVVNHAIAGAKRSTGSDVIVFYNTGSAINMGKSYSRIAARRISGGTTVGAETTIGIAPATTTAQSESVDSVVLGSSDRVHLFWTQGSGSGLTSALKHRCVKSSDNLDGTSPATAATTPASAKGGLHGGAVIEAVLHSGGQAFLSTANVICLPFATGSAGSTPDASITTATDADSPTWSVAAAASDSFAEGPVIAARGATNFVGSVGGAPFDGTTKYIAWVGATSGDPKYDKDTGGGFGTDVAIEATTATLISANIYTRGTDVVLAVIYDQAGTWVYNEVVLRSTVTTTFPFPAVRMLMKV